MKIVVISSIFRPYQRGGAEVMVDAIVRELILRGHEVLVCTASEWRGLSSLWPHGESVDGAMVYRWFPLNFFSFLNIERHSFGFRVLWHLVDLVNVHSYLMIRMILRRERPDLVLGHVIKGLGYTVPRAVIASRTPYIQTLHDVQLVVPNGLLLHGEERLLEQWYMRWYRLITRRLISSPGRVLFPSRFLADFHRRYGFFSRSRAIVAPNPIAQMIRNSRSAQKSSRDIVFLYVGQLESAKGVAWLTEVFLKQSATDWTLVIAGAGSLEGTLSMTAAKDSRISLVGRVSGEVLIELYRKADFLIVPSLCYENDPLVISEAMSVGTPVIAADIGGVGERIIEGKNGLLFTAGNGAELIAALYEADTIVRSGRWQVVSDAAVATVEAGDMAQYIATVLDQTNRL